MLITLCGIVISFNNSHDSNALLPILVTLEGIINVVDVERYEIRTVISEL